MPGEHRSSWRSRRRLLGRRFGCLLCNRHYSTQARLNFHVDYTHRFPCEYCGRVFGSEGGLEYHLGRSHPNGTNFDEMGGDFCCPVCQVGFANQVNLNQICDPGASSCSSRNSCVLLA